MISSRGKNMILLMALLALNIFAIEEATSQTTGDYRSAASGDWNSFTSTITWERYDGTNWVQVTTETDLPSSTNPITILADHSITVPSGYDATCASLTAETTNSDHNLTINGTLTVGVSGGGAVVLSAPINNATMTINVVGASASMSCGSIAMAATNTNNRVLTVTTDDGTITVVGDITMDGDGIRNIVSITGSGKLNIGGSFLGILGGAFDPGANSTVEYTGGGTQNIRAADYHNLFFSGGGTKTLDGNTSISNTLNFTSGNVNLNSFNLTLGTGATTPTRGTLSHTGTASSGWMYGDGNFVRYFSTDEIAIEDVAGLFPVGTDTDFRPLHLGVAPNALSTGGTDTVRHIGSLNITDIDPDLPDDGTSIKIRRDALWEVSTNGMTESTPGGLSLRIGGTGFGPIGDPDHLRLMKDNIVVGTHGATSDAPAFTTRTGLSLNDINGNFYIGSTDALASPLPITLQTFTATPQNDQVLLQWTTAGEEDNDYMAVERSADGQRFTEIGRVPGVGTTTEPQTYRLMDTQPLPGVSYYRLRQVDFDGVFEYFPVVSVRRDGGADLQLAAFPNPAADQIRIQWSPEQNETAVLRLFDLNGREVSQYTTGDDYFDLPVRELPRGVYLLQVVRGRQTQSLRIQVGRI